MGQKLTVWQTCNGTKTNNVANCRAMKTLTVLQICPFNPFNGGNSRSVRAKKYCTYIYSFAIIAPCFTNCKLYIHWRHRKQINSCQHLASIKSAILLRKAARELGSSADQLGKARSAADTAWSTCPHRARSTHSYKSRSRFPECFAHIQYLVVITPRGAKPCRLP